MGQSWVEESPWKQNRLTEITAAWYPSTPPGLEGGPWTYPPYLHSSFPHFSTFLLLFILLFFPSFSRHFSFVPSPSLPSPFLSSFLFSSFPNSLLPLFSPLSLHLLPFFNVLTLPQSPFLPSNSLPILRPPSPLSLFLHPHPSPCSSSLP